MMAQPGQQRASDDVAINIMIMTTIMTAMEVAMQSRAK